MTEAIVPPEKSVHALTLEDFDACPVWDTEKWDVGGGIDLSVRPLVGHGAIDGTERFPWIRCTGSLADGTPVQAISNLSVHPPAIDLPSLWLDGKWHVFFLPPAPDFVLAKKGPEALARALGKSLSEVFPMTLSTEVLVAPLNRPVVSVFTVTGVSAV
ncbi:MAG TPA: hypothetical protein VL084_15850 [Thermoanaerobaculia bacterium]|nr:hypothetical protein [Thermoanaerobaculia bacterium]